MSSPVRTPARADLLELATLYGAQIAYDDVTGQRQVASAESLLRILPLLGAPLERLGDVPQALHERRLQPWQRGLEPVNLSWADEPASVLLRLSAAAAQGRIRSELLLEDGTTRQLD